jgi:hypothetical protein
VRRRGAGTCHGSFKTTNLRPTAAIAYVLPRSKVAQAKACDTKFNGTEAIARLVERAERSFNAVDAVVLEAVLVRHPEAREKIGAGVKDFSVRSADFGTKASDPKVALHFWDFSDAFF